MLAAVMHHPRRGERSVPGDRCVGYVAAGDYTVAPGRRHADVIGTRAQAAGTDHTLGLQVVGEYAADVEGVGIGHEAPIAAVRRRAALDRRSVGGGRSVSVREDSVGGRIL